MLTGKKSKDEAAQLASIHVEISVSGLGIDSWTEGIVARAVQLDMRPTGDCACLYVIWDANTIHQGHEFMPASPPHRFQPPVVVPRTFDHGDTARWTEELAREGFVVLRDVIGAREVALAGSLLAEDIGRLSNRGPVELDDVIKPCV